MKTNVRKTERCSIRANSIFPKLLGAPFIKYGLEREITAGQA